MTNALSAQHWLDVIKDEYLGSFVRDGGSSIKFVVPGGDGLADLLDRQLAAMAADLGYLVVKVDAADTRVHMPQDIFFRIAEQVDWRVLARKVILKLCDERRYQTPAIDAQSNIPLLQAISAANDMAEDLVLQRMRTALSQSVFLNRDMARDFRSAMTSLCLSELGGEGRGLEAQPIQEWLTGKNRRVSNVRAYSIYNLIGRTNAKHFLESLLHWVRFVGYSGMVIILDDARVILPRNPRDGRRHYSKAMAMDHYELLRELIDNTDRLAGLFLVVLASEDFLDDRGKGLYIYQALQSRIVEEVWARNQTNPLSTLVRLAA